LVWAKGSSSDQACSTSGSRLGTFSRWPESPPAVAEPAAATGLSPAQADHALHQPLCFVFAICHQAVEFADIAGALDALKRVGIPVMKLQAAAAIRIPEMSRDAVTALRRFGDPVYLHSRAWSGEMQS
jgi:hypothetical protein